MHKSRWIILLKRSDFIKPISIGFLYKLHRDRIKESGAEMAWASFL